MSEKFTVNTVYLPYWANLSELAALWLLDRNCDRAGIVMAPGYRVQTCDRRLAAPANAAESLEAGRVYIGTGGLDHFDALAQEGRQAAEGESPFSLMAKYLRVDRRADLWQLMPQDRAPETYRELNKVIDDLWNNFTGIGDLLTTVFALLDAHSASQREYYEAGVLLKKADTESIGDLKIAIVRGALNRKIGARACGSRGEYDALIQMPRSGHIWIYFKRDSGIDLPAIAVAVRRQEMSMRGMEDNFNDEDLSNPWSPLGLPWQLEGLTLHNGGPESPTAETTVLTVDEILSILTS